MSSIVRNLAIIFRAGWFFPISCTTGMFAAYPLVSRSYEYHMDKGDKPHPFFIVWYFRGSRSGSNSSTRATTDNFLIQDEYGVCAVDSAKADIVPTTHKASHAFLDTRRTSVEKIIHAGDPVFAIGELRRGLPPLAGMPEVQCQLAGGVMLVSGSPERYVKVLYGLWFLVQAPLTLLFLGLLTFGAWIHISSYPPGDGNAVTTFFESLRANPWQSDPGLERQLRDQAAKQAHEAKP